MHAHFSYIHVLLFLFPSMIFNFHTFCSNRKKKKNQKSCQQKKNIELSGQIHKYSEEKFYLFDCCCHLWSRDSKQIDMLFMFNTSAQRPHFEWISLFSTFIIILFYWNVSIHLFDGTSVEDEEGREKIANTITLNHSLTHLHDKKNLNKNSTIVRHAQ